MEWIKFMFHRCHNLEKSCNGITGMILKCPECGRRFKITWDDFKQMAREVAFNEAPIDKDLDKAIGLPEPPKGGNDE